MKFYKYNENPKGKKTGDCVVRAIAYATNKIWLETFDGLAKIARENCDMMSCKGTYEKYLLQQGFIKQKMPKKADGKRYTIKEFFDKYKFNKPVIVSVASHLTCVDDNDLVDIWDCSFKSICNYYIKNDDKISLR